VDTLDNLGFVHSYKNQQTSICAFGFGEENAERIQAQNDRKISVIMGNPPYNANQQNENDNNKNREYPEIDTAIKKTYIANSTAQKTKVYDMYARFFRWASSRLSVNGILAFVTNSSFLEARTFDGFRKVVAEEFDAIYVLDLGGNIRKGSKSNVFGIKIGVAISFLIKDVNNLSKNCQIFHACVPEFQTATEKLAFLRMSNFHQINFERIIPNENHDWINQSDNDFSLLLSLADKKTKLAKSKDKESEKSVFKIFSLGISTNRDEWVYDFNQMNIETKIQFFLDEYDRQLKSYKGEVSRIDMTIAWSRDLKKKFASNKAKKFSKENFRKALYRPFITKELYFDYLLDDVRGLHETFFPSVQINNQLICFTDTGSEKPFLTLVSNKIPDLHLSSPGCGTQCLPLYCYDSEGNRTENITNWGLNQFRTHYQDNTITKEDIFHYTYSVLHNPAYRKKYALNLKREFPRLPFYEDFNQWAAWGKQLMDLHLNFESVEKYPLKRIDKKLPTNAQNKPKLKADKEAGKIYLDAITTLQGVPSDAWEYKLGNRSALEWILDQYKEKKPRDKTIAEKFNSYRFADYKEQVVELLLRVCTVSVETVGIVKKMP
jgi:predicted helicase